MFGDVKKSSGLTRFPPFHTADGENWFTSRSSLGPIPLTDDLESATAVLKKFTALEEDLHLRGIQKAAEIVLDVWTTFVQNTTFRKSRVLLGGFKHDDATDLNWLQSVHDSNVTAGRMASSQRSLEWLREFGTCGDHIVGQRSTLAQAGMGAFATRTLPRETVVAQLPMIHITDRARLNMYRLQRNGEGDLAPVDDTVTGHQLLLNYCYGHGESTMLLCPYGPLVNYVNHNQTLANVRLQWGKEFKGNHMPALLDDTVEKIENSDATAKLAMEFVALRVIQAGEEIFLDYGDDWEASWTAHVNGWSPVPNADKYVSAMQLESDNTTRLRTVYEEIREKTYSEHVVMMCDTACENEAEEVERHYKNGTLNEFLLENDASWWPCSVLRYRSIEGKSKNYISDSATNEEEYLYTIHLYKNDNGKMINNYLIKDVPRAIFHFVDKPYASDTFLPNAFRHDIRIPESIFPESWRNKRTQEDAVDSA